MLQRRPSTLDPDAEGKVLRFAARMVATPGAELISPHDLGRRCVALLLPGAYCSCSRRLFFPFVVLHQLARLGATGACSLPLAL